VKSDLTHRMTDGFAANGIDIPVPTSIETARAA
jgi:hypothetical protein